MNEPSAEPDLRRRALRSLLTLIVGGLFCFAALGSSSADAQDDGDITELGPAVFTTADREPGEVDDADSGSEGLRIDIGVGDGEEPSNTVLILVAITLLSLAPSLLVMLSSFTRIVIVLSLVRNALGLQGIPPNQVIVGLALFLSVFVMGPTLEQMNEEALQPYLAGDIDATEAYETAVVPLRGFMLENTRNEEIEMMLAVSDEQAPESPDDIGLLTLIPAFILSELKTAFIIGFIIFIPFLVLDLVVSAVLMSLGMMMLPPVFVSLPFKILVFVLVGGWSLIAETLLMSFS